VYVARHGGNALNGLQSFITIRWEEPTETGGLPILGYTVSMRKDDQTWAMAFDGSVRPDILSNKFEELQSGSKYEFKVWSRNKLGYSAQASEILTVYAAKYPYKMDPVRQVSVTANGILSSITLEWTAAQYDGGLSVQGYYLQMNAGYGTDLLDTLYQVTSGTQYTFNNLIAGVTYEFRISAFNILEAENKQFDEALNFSGKVSFVIANEPDQITDVAQRITEYEVGKIKLEWSPPNDNGSPILEYIVTRDVGYGVYFEIGKSNESAYTDMNLESGKTYNYKVKSLNVIGLSIESDIVSGIAGQLSDQIQT
jgi:titin